MNKWIAKLYYMVRTNGRKIIPASNRYHERDATRNTMDPDAVEAHVSSTRQNSIRLMEQRAAEIEAGLEHHTPAMAESLTKLGQ